MLVQGLLQFARLFRHPTFSLAAPHLLIVGPSCTKFTPLQICFGGEREPALDRSIVLTPLDRIFDQVMGLAFLKGDELRSEMRSFQDLIKLGDDNILKT
jgi:hypothetical protein